MSMQLLCLDDLIAQIVTALNDDAAVIYWHHDFSRFDWLRASDLSTYHESLRNLGRAVKNGDIASVKAGETFQVENKALYPMELECRGMECHAYMLIRRRGLFEDSSKTPYLFIAPSTRDKAISYLNKKFKKEGA